MTVFRQKGVEGAYYIKKQASFAERKPVFDATASSVNIGVLLCPLRSKGASH
jgi:hypothetical protein